MKSRRQNDAEDGHTVTQPNKRSKTYENVSENLLPIPIDLLIEIFSRFPAKDVAKYIARFRCVSKLWASTLSDPDFTGMFYLAPSSSRPQLLFASQQNGELFFFSSAQPQNLDENLSPVSVSYLSKVRLNFSCERFSTVNGFLCLRKEQILKGRKTLELWFIYNPTTGQSLHLPKMKTVGQKCYFGYDPVKKQYKVLSMSKGIYNGNWKECQVLTLGTGKLSWRMMEYYVPHRPLIHNEICINGVLYYRANGDGFTKVTMVVCFDFSSEKFSFMNVTQSFSRAVDYRATLINYNGKLGSLRWEERCTVCERPRSFELWVLEDAEKHEWSKHIYVLPPLWMESVKLADLFFVGVIGTDEIVLSPTHASTPFYVFYYNIKTKTIVRVEIQGMEEVTGSRIRTLVNHVENMNLM